MRLSRLIPAALAGALLAATFGPPAQAATPGVGSTAGTLTVLGVDAGGLLSLDLLSDRGDANTNPAIGTPSAAAELAALVVESPAAGISESIPVVSTSSTGEEQTASQAVTPVDNPVVSGSLLPINLSAAVADAGATSDIVAGLADLSVLSGVVSLSGTELGLGSNALTNQADGTRGLTLDALTVLDLEALLAGLGIPLTALPLDTVLDLLDGLGVLGELETVLEGLGLTVPAEITPDALIELIAGLGFVEDAVATIGDNVAPCEDADIPTALDDLVNGLPGDLGDLADATCDEIVNVVDTAVGVVADPGAALDDVLQAILDLLGGQALVAVDGLTVAVTTKATDALETSSATVTAALGDIRVGDLVVPGVDLTSTTEQLTAAVDQVESTVGGLLAIIDPSLADLVDIGLLEEQTSVTQSNGAIVSDAAFTALRVDVLPNVAELEALITRLASLETLGDVLADAGVELPAGPLDEVTTLLAGVTTSGLELPEAGGVLPLSEGVGVRLASLSQRSTFAPQVTPATPVTSLPQTGSNDGLLLLLGAGGVVAALGARRWVRGEQ